MLKDELVDVDAKSMDSFEAKLKGVYDEIQAGRERADLLLQAAVELANQSKKEVRKERLAAGYQKRKLTTKLESRWCGKEFAKILGNFSQILKCNEAYMSSNIPVF